MADGITATAISMAVSEAATAVKPAKQAEIN
jgi:hypothetical protein